MYRIVTRAQFSPVTYLWELHAPDIAKTAGPGQFVIVRHGEKGERIPLTVADSDRTKGTITLVIHAVGKTTYTLMELQQGEFVDEVFGPLGNARHCGRLNKVICVGGGVGVAGVYPHLCEYWGMGARTISIMSFVTRDLMFWVDRFKARSDDCIVCTDDGSFGVKRPAAEALQEVLEKHQDIDEVLAIGSLVMMKACAELTRPRSIRTVVSVKPIIVDGIGLCGGCRVTVGGQRKYACLDGPEFDGHEVDFEELALRMKRFEREERESLRLYQECRHTSRSV